MTGYVGRVLDSYFAVVVDNNVSSVMYFDDVNDTVVTGYNLTNLSSNFTFGLFGDTTDRVVLPLFLSIIGVIALVGNAFVIYNVTSYKRMRTGPNMMLANIACADVVFVACVVPMSTVNHATAGLAMLHHAWLVQTCKIVHYVMFVTIYVSVYTLVVTCVFSYCGECMRCKTTTAMLSGTNVVISCIVIWASFICSHLTLLLPEDGAIFQEAFICVHTDDLLSGDTVKLRTLWLTFLACAFLFPTLAICLLSALVLRSQLRYRRRRDTSCDVEKLSEIRRKRELIMVVMVSMIVRAVCWLPIQLFVLLYLFAEADTSAFVYQLADMVGVIAIFIGACLNPILYNYMSSELRQAFGETYQKSMCKCSQVKNDGEYSDMNETIMSIISDSSNHINYT
ncbi:G-protein coupled receptor 54 [Lamellibrachia satsuma]|nr:G-protein coupled receptor 54 [Lamellibrachia satsuma]